jgi:hypothetical protein
VSRALLRYLAADVSGGQRWLAPALVFAAVVVPFNVGGGPARSIYAFSTTLLLAIAVWLTIAVLSTEDPAQAAVTVAAAGSLPVRLGKLLVAYAGAVLLGGFGVLWPLLIGHPATGADIGAGVAGHLLAGLAGVGVGALLGRPVIRQRAWSVLLAVLVVVVEIAVPHSPPTRQLLAQYDSPHHYAGLAGTAAVTVLLTAAVVTAAHWLARSRE